MKPLENLWIGNGGVSTPIPAAGWRGVGFAGAWSTTHQGGNPFYVQSPGLTFTDGGGNGLPVDGISASRPANQGRAQANRQLSAAARTALFADNTTMRFSVLYRKTDSAENAGFVIGADTFDVANHPDVALNPLEMLLTSPQVLLDWTQVVLLTGL